MQKRKGEQSQLEANLTRGNLFTRGVAEEIERWGGKHHGSFLEPTNHHWGKGMGNLVLA